MENIDLVTMLPGAVKVDDQNVNPTWKAHVLHNDSSISVSYVKLIDARKIFIECFCAVLGRSIGLPIPKPFLVNVPHESLSCSVPDGQSCIAFGSEDAAYPSFRRKFNQSQPEAMRLLKAYSKILDVSVFDEWIGNGDRNIGNILYDGKSLFNFIDHELALPKGLNKDNFATKNQLMSSCFSTVSELEKHRASKKILNDIHPSMSGIDLKSALDNCLASVYFNEASAEELKDIVSDRLSTLAHHSDLRMGIKQQGLAI
ncbi:hypothetical protein QNZ72_000921 [Vibrio parahaemolyticus]|nr:hypothetical protein [Vibrio parahaemolyticus]